MNLTKCKFLFYVVYIEEYTFSRKVSLATIGVCVFVRLTSVAALFIFSELFMNIYTVCFIGHREIPDIRETEEKLQKVIEDLIRQKEYVEFYVGRNGDFDISVASAVKRAQNKCGHENSSLILVLPYKNKDIEYFKYYYDEVILPVSSDTHFKAAIKKRNEWMADNSDMLIAYVSKESGGAYEMLKYAELQKTTIIKINDLIF